MFTDCRGYAGMFTVCRDYVRRLLNLCLLLQNSVMDRILWVIEFWRLAIRNSNSFCYEFARIVIRFTALFGLLATALSIQNSEAQADSSGQHSLSFKVLRNVSHKVGIDQICCNSAKYAFPEETTSEVRVRYGGDAIWLKIENIEDAGLIQLSPIIDEVTLFFRRDDAVNWSQVHTGDQITNDVKIFRSPFMVLPLDDNIDRENVYIRIIQSTVISIQAKAWQLPAFSEMQQNDLVYKVFLFGFVIAIVLYNIFVTFLVKDLVFLFNALSIFCLLIISLYLSGYGTVFFWGQWVGWSNAIFATSAYFGVFFGSIFICLFLRSENETLGNIRLIFIAPVIATFGAISALFLPYWSIQLIMLLSAGLLFVTMSYLAVARAIRGDMKARILLVPIVFAMLPGISLLALDKIFGVTPLNLGNNGLEATLCLEAILFSLALASRIRIAERAIYKMQNSILELRTESATNAIRAQDAERKRLALELHDGVGQDLLVVQAGLKKLNGHDQSASSKADLSQIIQDSSRILKELRRISHDMYPAAIEHLGIIKAMQSLFERFENSTQIGTQAKLDFDESRLDGDTQLHVYRIVQVCLANIGRHSLAKKCVIEMNQTGDNLQIRMEDDGVGLKHEEGSTDSNHGLGLVSIEERVRIVNGKWQSDHGLLGGLRVNISIPLLQPNQ